MPRGERDMASGIHATRAQLHFIVGDSKQAFVVELMMFTVTRRDVMIDIDEHAFVVVGFHTGMCAVEVLGDQISSYQIYRQDHQHNEQAVQISLIG